jgi:hypothetical protein
MFHAEEVLLEPIIASFNEELDLITQFGRTFEKHHLESLLSG